MNVLIITPDIYPFQKGYGGKNPLNLFEAFSRLGHNTWLIASVPDRESFNMDSKGFTVHFDIIKLHSLNFIPRDFDYFFPLISVTCVRLKKPCAEKIMTS